MSADSSTDERRVWLYAPGRQARYWDDDQRDGVAAIGWNSTGPVTDYASKADVLDELVAQTGGERRPTNDALGLWEFAMRMQPGDEVFVKKGRRLIVGYGVVTGDYAFDADRGPHGHIRPVDWRWTGEVRPREKSLVMKTLTDVTDYEQLVRDLRACIRTDDDEDDEGTEFAPFLVADALRDLFMPQDEFESLLALLRRKKNLVLQGPPGTGKTFVAARLAFALMGEKATDRLQRVQFHASMSYEDFVQGYRPQKGGGFERQDGTFFSFCDHALQDPENDYVLLIDEINRADLGRVFGELLMLLEADKRSRDWGVALTYAEPDDANFHVPPNVHVIGTMNTADRSLALVDYALRRRFVFADLMPAFGRPEFRAFLTTRVGAELADEWIRRLAKVNARIADDPALGRGFQLGHSFICAPPDTDLSDWFEDVVRFELAPLLREYWFDEPDVVDACTRLLREGH